MHTIHKRSALLLLVLVLGCVSGATPDAVSDPPGPPLDDVDPHALLSAVLGDHVVDGMVNYKALCRDGRLEEYVARLAATDPATISDDKAKLAFWINVYNAYTLKIICDNYPVKSINDLHFGGLIIGTVVNKTAWDKKFVVVGGEVMSLNHVEHDIVRPVFQDPRAHFALVCAAKSCPPLRPEAYDGDRLDTQLDDQGTMFFAQKDKNFFELDKNQAHLSKILDWYGGDFGGSREERLVYITQYLPDGIAEAIRADPASWSIKFTEYDWDLNDAPNQ